MSSDNFSKIKEASNSLAEPSWLLTWREKRLELVETLPKTLQYGLGISAFLPNLSKGSLWINGQTTEYHVDASKGLEVYTWKEAVNQEEIAPILRGLMESELFPLPSNYYDGMAQAIFGSGIVVYVQPNMNEKDEFVTEKLSLDTLVPSGESADIVIVIAKEGSKLEMTGLLTGGSDTAICARTLVVMTEQDAEVSIELKETLTKGATVLMRTEAIVAAHSRVVWSEQYIGHAHMRSEGEHLLVGESAETQIRQAVIAQDSLHHDISATVRHIASHTTSSILAAGVATGDSKTIYRGLIDMKKGVMGVKGGQEARFLVLSPTAKVDAIPSLDIASKDVQCEHKLAITHVHESDTFYPKLRGLSDGESRRLFLTGHFSTLFSGKDDELSTEITQKLDTL